MRSPERYPTFPARLSLPTPPEGVSSVQSRFTIDWTAEAVADFREPAMRAEAALQSLRWLVERTAGYSGRGEWGYHTAIDHLDGRGCVSGTPDTFRVLRDSGSWPRSVRDIFHRALLVPSRRGAVAAWRTDHRLVAPVDAPNLRVIPYPIYRGACAPLNSPQLWTLLDGLHQLRGRMKRQLNPYHADAMHVHGVSLSLNHIGQTHRTGRHRLGWFLVLHYGYGGDVYSSWRHVLAQQAEREPFLGMLARGVDALHELAAPYVRDNDDLDTLEPTPGFDPNTLDLSCESRRRTLNYYSGI